MGLEAALDVGHLSILNNLLRLNVDFDVSGKEDELIVDHADEILNVVLIHLLVMDYELDLVAGRQAADDDAQAYLRAVGRLDFVVGTAMVVVRMQLLQLLLGAIEVLFTSRSRGPTVVQEAFVALLLIYRGHLQAG